jgi:hypothetical protein
MPKNNMYFLAVLSYNVKKKPEIANEIIKDVLDKIPNRASGIKAKNEMATNRINAFAVSSDLSWSFFLEN